MAKWNKGVLDSFLIEITRDVLYYNDDDGTPLVEKILDSAGQKGTGKWTAINALDLGMPVTLIGEAVFARCLSSLKEERGRAAKVLAGPEPHLSSDKKDFIDNLEQALYASKIISYAQGFMLIQNVSLLHHNCDEMLTLLSAGGQGVRMEAQQAVYRAHVAWRLHHSLRLPQGYYPRIPTKSRPREPALRRLLQQGHPQSPARMERRGQQRHSLGDPNASLQHGAQLLRRVPQQGPSGQLATSTARLLWRSYVPHQARVCYGQVSRRQGHSRQLDWQGWQRVGVHLQGLGLGFFRRTQQAPRPRTQQYGRIASANESFATMCI